ncbi:RmlC-like cupin domain-containing protein [Aspergillus floccosus]
MGDPTTEPPSVQKLIRSLGLEPHIEGGYFVETDRDKQKVALTSNEDVRAVQPNGSASPDNKRHLITSIFYCLTPRSPIGAFHRNQSRTVHTLHRGRGTYVTLTPKDDGVDIETFAVGHDVTKGERLQWIVEGGSYKASYLLPDDDDSNSSVLLISETVVPGFEFNDHDFLRRDALHDMVGGADFEQLKALLRENFSSEQYSN